MNALLRWWAVRIFSACVALPGVVSAQSLAEHMIEVDGENLYFSLRTFSPAANVVDPAAPLQPDSALETAKLLNRFLTAGKVEDAALLSNSPRRRFEVLQDYQAAVGDNGFKEVFTEYFNPANRLMGEVVMGAHSLLVWHLGQRTRDGAQHYVGQYYVEVEGKVLMDDVPNETRTRLSRILEAVRSGRLSFPSS